MIVNWRNYFVSVNLHLYVNLSQDITKDIESGKERCVFQKKDKSFVSGFEVIAHDDGVFPPSIGQKLAEQNRTEQKFIDLGG